MIDIISNLEMQEYNGPNTKYGIKHMCASFAYITAQWIVYDWSKKQLSACCFFSLRTVLIYVNTAYVDLPLATFL